MSRNRDSLTYLQMQDLTYGKCSTCFLESKYVMPRGFNGQKGQERIKIHQRDSESRKIGKIKVKWMSIEEMARM